MHKVCMGTEKMLSLNEAMQINTTESSIYSARWKDVLG